MTTACVDDLSRITADICVVGSGPVGLALSVALAGHGVSVILLESGLAAPDDAKKSLSDLHTAEGDRQADMKLAVARAFGGTGWLWGGRCVPLDEIDFAPRQEVDPLGWPIDFDEVTAYSARAAGLIGCGGSSFEVPLPPGISAPGPDLTLCRVERWCERPNVGALLKRRGLPSGLTVVLDATVVEVVLGHDKKRVASLRIASCGSEVVFTGARYFVLACGGLETTRLLLHMQQRHAELFGGPEGPLGRFYMGHVSGKVAKIRFEDPQMARLFAYSTDAEGVYRRRFSLSASVLTRERLPNVIFYPDNPKLGDPTHGSGLLSALFLALSMPVIGKKLISEAIFRSQVGGPPRYTAHMRNLVLDAPWAIVQIADVLKQRFFLGRTKPFVFQETKTGVYPLHYHSEHLPSAASRVRLSTARDPLGLCKLHVDLRFSQADALGVARAHDVFGEALSRVGLAALELEVPRAGLEDAVLDGARDGIHQIGLARMGRSASDGVVDADCRVFGLDNLYLAGSAVFRTSGQANPTFSAVALAIRLADHLASMSAGPVTKATSVIQ